MNLLCQGAGGLWWTGLGWATPCGGQALMRSHRPRCMFGVGSTGHYQDNAGWRVSRLIGSGPTHVLKRSPGRCLKVLAGDVAFQTAHDLWGAERPSVRLRVT